MHRHIKNFKSQVSIYDKYKLYHGFHKTYRCRKECTCLHAHEGPCQCKGSNSKNEGEKEYVVIIHGSITPGTFQDTTKIYTVFFGNSCPVYKRGVWGVTCYICNVSDNSPISRNTRAGVIQLYLRMCIIRMCLKYGENFLEGLNDEN